MEDLVYFVFVRNEKRNFVVINKFQTSIPTCSPQKLVTVYIFIPFTSDFIHHQNDYSLRYLLKVTLLTWEVFWHWFEHCSCWTAISRRTSTSLTETRSGPWRRWWPTWSTDAHALILRRNISLRPSGRSASSSVTWPPSSKTSWTNRSGKEKWVKK